MAEKDPLQVLKEGGSLLLAGTTEGYVVVVRPQHGEVQFSVQGHEGEVFAIATNVKRQQIISAGRGEEREWEGGKEGGRLLLHHLLG